MNQKDKDLLAGAILGGLLGNIFLPGLGGTIAGGIIGALLISRDGKQDDKEDSGDKK